MLSRHQFLFVFVCCRAAVELELREIVSIYQENMAARAARTTATSPATPPQAALQIVSVMLLSG